MRDSSERRASNGPALDAAQAERGQMLADISNSVVRIHKQFYGKGPTKARSHYSQDLLVVVLQGGFTRGEQTLRDRGHLREVLQSRLAMQSAVEGEFRAAVEGIVGRPVLSFMSANDPGHNLQVEIFVFSSREGGPPAGADAEDDLFARAQRAREQHREILDEHRALRSEQEQSSGALRKGRQAHPHAPS